MSISLLYSCSYATLLVLIQVLDQVLNFPCSTEILTKY